MEGQFAKPMKQPKELDLKLPPGAKVVGHLYDDTGITHFSEDLLCVTLRNDVSIDVGWYPDEDPSGEFRIHIFRGNWCNTISPNFHTKIVAEVISFVERKAFDLHKFATASLCCGQCKEHIAAGDKLRAICCEENDGYYVAVCRSCICKLPTDHELIFPMPLAMHFAVSDINLSGTYTISQFTLADQICYLDPKVVKEYLPDLYLEVTSAKVF